MGANSGGGLELMIEVWCGLELMVGENWNL